jgi:hypothetical protein
MMKSMFIAMATAGALSLALTGTASASASGHPKHHPKPAPKPAAQVTGKQLASALLPGETIGDGYTSMGTLDSGNSLASTTVLYRVPAMSCGDFEVDYGTPVGFGNSAGATEFFLNPNWQGGPDVAFGYQDVLQFPSIKTAASFYGQALAKYQACVNFSEPNPEDPTPGGGTIDVSSSTLAKTTVGQYQAFQVTQLSALSESPGQTSYNDILMAVAGTNIYQLWENSGTNDEPSPTLMAQLISQVQKLYPRG